MIPNNDNEKEFLERIQKLEEKNFDGTKENLYKSSRELSRAISEGEVENQFIGKKNIVVLQRELTNHEQSFQETFSDSERSKWFNKRNQIVQQMNQLEKESQQRGN